MTLHEAIEKVLRQKGMSMTTQQIADELNENNWYNKRDGSKILAFQIHGRTRNYSHLFKREGASVSLIEKSIINTITNKTKIIKPILELTDISLKDKLLFENDLMNEKKYRKASEIDNIVPNTSGIYCIRISNIDKIPNPFNLFLSDRRHNIIYMGIAKKSLRTRFLNQELRANGHGTFFRSIGAILGYRPLKGSLVSKKNKHNYKFSNTDEQKIINWINDNLVVNWIEFNDDFDTLEKSLIQKYKPLINISKNPSALKELSDLRKICVHIANNKK
ncbi:GIY-YIG nuclease family protein [Paenimyroides aestuarii]|uniref:HTH domain-containing protein n=1 Tax=Paenimyroides aestuarii TaxID=2968490 RepID=A0ABY5NQ59_9FLAO|nr:HTH domain-containing protein [Paenimyroides aestuarii]UUV20651.1 HTH domain-containing protein [Paenimyroides aestuarii]